jgi:C1A family cysteine protease
MIISKYKYGLKPDRKDLRDFIYKPTLSKLPKQVDLRSQFPAVYDQGQLGSCTANACVGLLEYLEITAKMGSFQVETLSEVSPSECLEYLYNLGRIFEKDFVALSRLFLYWQTRNLEGTVDEDAGATLMDCMKVMQKIGVCPEVDFPYDITKFKVPPSKQANADAQVHKISAYFRVSDLDHLKAALAEGHPVIFGFYVYESFESEKVAKTGVCPKPKKGEQLLGGHAVVAVGYQDGILGGKVLIRNSWGALWGQQGYFTMSYDVFNQLVMDQWIGLDDNFTAKKNEAMISHSGIITIWSALLTQVNTALEIYEKNGIMTAADRKTIIATVETQMGVTILELQLNSYLQTITTTLVNVMIPIVVDWIINKLVSKGIIVYVDSVKPPTTN